MPWMRTVFTWGEMIKFSHTVFALPFALIAVVLAGRTLPAGHPSIGQFLLIIACMVAARSFAMTFNRLADEKFDARNPRTAGRPLPAGKITKGQARLFLWVSCGGFVFSCAGFRWAWANSWPLALAAPTLLALAGYSWCKRWTRFAHFFLGAVISFGPVAAWIAINPATLGRPVVVLSLAVCFWIAGFDLIYACQDADVDRKEGLFSIPAAWGIGPALAISRLCHAATVVFLIMFGSMANLGRIYGAGVALTCVLLVVEQSLVKANDLSRVNVAFFTVNGVVSLALAAATIADVLLRG